ncbi:MAG TPA: TlpA disulfide reductase family protein [Hyphomonadaceae bacterium]|nr:TlpA disulfide reductase family protein [Hyphomonadaceae bacterium]
MRLLILSVGVLLAACQRETVASQEPGPAPAPPVAVDVSSRQAGHIEGWQTHGAVCNLLTTPEFSLQKLGGGSVTHEQLRGRWTILGFWNATLAGVADEVRYLRALNSAANQDPDLDLVTVYLKLDAAGTDVAGWFAKNGGDPWPTLIDEGGAGGTFGVTVLPAYFLIGPDLTIRACRGALSSDPDGIKSVIRGVAEVRRKVAAPQ